MSCPFCDADQPELISLFGSQLLTSQYRCRACGAYFEGLRQDRSPRPLGEVARSAGEGTARGTMPSLQDVRPHPEAVPEVEGKEDR